MKRRAAIATVAAAATCAGAMTAEESLAAYYRRDAKLARSGQSPHWLNPIDNMNENEVLALTGGLLLFYAGTLTVTAVGALAIAGWARRLF